MNSYQPRRPKEGFTIVELLVVLVIIATLITITSIAYRSVQARSRSASASSLAGMVTKKAESWYYALGAYPTYTQLSTGKINSGDTTLTGPAESRITDATGTLLNAASVDPTNEKQVAYRPCTAGGAQVEWYDATTSTVKYTGVGGGSSTAACT